jgi:agmatinase
VTRRFRPISPREVPRFGGVSTFLRLPQHDDPADLDAMIVGAPFDGGTSFRPGARFGPRAVREASALTRGFHPEQGVDVFEVLDVADGGDVVCIPMDLPRTLSNVQGRVASILAAGCLPMVVGGDNTISLGALRAIAKAHGPVGLVHFDAHSDTYPPAWGCDPHHGTVFRNAVEEDLLQPHRVIQIGLRGPYSTRGDLEYARDHGFHLVSAADVRADVAAVAGRMAEVVRRGRVYVSLDIDCVDPAFAPGTGTPVPGGLTSLEILQLVRALRGLDLVGFELVEIAPAYDSSGITSLLGATLLAEALAAYAGTVARRRQGRLPAGRPTPRLPAGPRRPRTRR